VSCLGFRAGVGPRRDFGVAQGDLDDSCPNNRSQASSCGASLIPAAGSTHQTTFEGQESPSLKFSLFPSHPPKVKMHSGGVGFPCAGGGSEGGPGPCCASRPSSCRCSGLVPHILGDVIFLWCCNLLAHFINTYAVDDNVSGSARQRVWGARTKHLQLKGVSGRLMANIIQTLGFG